jgi:glycosyltransferase involved in cell wall biosynthesis
VKIWQLGPPGEPYSPERGRVVSEVVANLSRELDSAGHQVTVLAEVAGHPFEDGADLLPLGVRLDERGAGVRLRAGAAINATTGWFGPGYPWRLASLRHRARHAPRPDVIVVHDDPRAVRHLHRWLPGVPVVAFQHSVPYRLPPERMPADRPDAVVAVTSSLVRRIAPRLGVFPADVAVVPYGVTPGPVAYSPADPARPLAVLALAGASEGDGSWLAQAGALEGASVSLVDGRRWSAVHGPSPRPVVLGAAALAPGAAVALADPAAALSVLAAHDVCCLLQDVDDAYPPLLLEALAAGCAVVALDTSGTTEVAGGVAHLVSPGNPAAVRTALSAWSKDHTLLAAVRARGPSAVAGRTWAATARALLDVLAATQG